MALWLISAELLCTADKVNMIYTAISASGFTLRDFKENWQFWSGISYSGVLLTIHDALQGLHVPSDRDLVVASMHSPHLHIYISREHLIKLWYCKYGYPRKLNVISKNRSISAGSLWIGLLNYIYLNLSPAEFEHNLSVLDQISSITYSNYINWKFN